MVRVTRLEPWIPTTSKWLPKLNPELFVFNVFNSAMIVILSFRVNALEWTLCGYINNNSSNSKLVLTPVDNNWFLTPGFSSNGSR